MFHFPDELSFLANDLRYLKIYGFVLSPYPSLFGIQIVPMRRMQGVLA